MTEQEMRIAMAESVGWKRVTVTENVMHWPGGILPTEVTRWSKHVISIDGKKVAACVHEEDELPNYTQDLNAIREVILHECEIGGYVFQADYQLKLQVVVERRRRDLTREQIGFWMNNASAAECTETYLRVKGLWK
jgi:hypothetical protein